MLFFFQCLSNLVFLMPSLVTPPCIDGMSLMMMMMASLTQD